MARSPLHLRNLTHASTFGPILPTRRWPCARYSACVCTLLLGSPFLIRLLNGVATKRNQQSFTQLKHHFQILTYRNFVQIYVHKGSVCVDLNLSFEFLRKREIGSPNQIELYNKTLILSCVKKLISCIRGNLT